MNNDSTDDTTHTSIANCANSLIQNNFNILIKQISCKVFWLNVSHRLELNIFNIVQCTKCTSHSHR